MLSKMTSHEQRPVSRTCKRTMTDAKASASERACPTNLVTMHVGTGMQSRVCGGRMYGELACLTAGASRPAAERQFGSRALKPKEDIHLSEAPHRFQAKQLDAAAVFRF
jgi:hypothetical protein